MKAVLQWTMLVFLICCPAFAQEAQPQAEGPPLLKPEELEQLVAPIALYQDDLLSQIFIASTYPLEVVKADRWVKANTKLTGEARNAELEKQDWDPNVKSLTNTPTVLANMADKLDWTQKLGDAVLAQQTDVMDAVQHLRSKAVDQKTLQTSPEQKVEVKTEENKEVIVIQSAQPNTVYVPYYDPSTAYGTWAYPSYPPAYYPPPPGYAAGSALVSGMMWGTGFAIAGAIWGDNDFNWGGGDMNVNVNKNFNQNNINRANRVNNGGTKWQHNPAHRGGVQYKNDAVRQKYNSGNRTARSTGTQRAGDFRGREGRTTSNQLSGRQTGAQRDRSAANQRTADRSRANNAPRRDVSGVDRRSNNAFSGVGSGNATRAQSDRGRSSFNDRGNSSFGGNRGGGGQVSRGGGGGRAAGGGGRGGGGGGGRRR